MKTSNSSRIIVVEGETDLHVVLHLLNRKNLQLHEIERKSQSIVVEIPGENNLRIEVCQEGGFNQMFEEIGVKLKKSELECIGFVFDANGDPKKQWRKVRGKILEKHRELQAESSSKLKKVFRETPVPEGLWVRDYSPKVGMWMMPNNKDTGEIEDFLSYMIHPKDHCWKHAQDYVETILQERKRFPGYKVIKENKALKAKIHAWLAVQEKPNRPPGEAIKRNYFNSNAPMAQPFQRWLGNLP